MSEIITVGLDLAKNVFQVHGADASGRAVLRKKLRRDQVLAFFSQLAALRRRDGSLWRRPFLGP
jgi:transposase